MSLRQIKATSGFGISRVRRSCYVSSMMMLSMVLSGVLTGLVFSRGRKTVVPEYGMRRLETSWHAWTMANLFGRLLGVKTKPTFLRFQAMERYGCGMQAAAHLPR